MTTIRIPLTDVEDAYLNQVEYSLSFASQDIESYSLVEEGVAIITLREGADEEQTKKKIMGLLERYTKREFGLKEAVHFKQERDLPLIDAWTELVKRRWVTPVGIGHVVLRGLAARLHRVVDAKVLRGFGSHFNAEEEFYPNTIRSTTLDRIEHFSSFPEHVDFISHLREDVDVLSTFADNCRTHGWKPELHENQMGPFDFAICPSCCYHCYEAMEGWELEKPGRCTTVLINCHRYEGSNLTTMSRLRAFHMRELIWIGHPEFVRKSREDADKLLVQWAKDWDLDCSFENANDLFFTDNYSIKASFQRQQEAKRELLLRIPFENKKISCASSNFHAATFGKAFGILLNGRPAVSACLGWGLERWVYAIFSQFGFDPSKWPIGLRKDIDRYSL